MIREQAEYDLKYLPQRQATIRAFARSSHNTVDAIRAYRKEYAENEQRLEQARAFLALEQIKEGRS